MNYSESFAFAITAFGFSFSDAQRPGLVAMYEVVAENWTGH